MRTLFKICFLGLLFFYCNLLHAQEMIDGIVFDKSTNQRIAKVKLKNLRTGAFIYNNTKGEFSVEMMKGDVLEATSKGYFSDSITWKDQKLILFKLVRESIYLDEVSIVAKKSPEEIFNSTMRDYSKAYRLADHGDIFSLPPTGGAGLSIGMIYNLFSKEAKNARKLTKTFEKEYKENVIDYKFTPELVGSVTQLSGKELERFMRIFRPSYFFVLESNDYKLVEYIRRCYRDYSYSPESFVLDTLPKIDLKLIP